MSGYHDDEEEYEPYEEDEEYHAYEEDELAELQAMMENPLPA